MKNLNILKIMAAGFLLAAPLPAAVQHGAGLALGLGGAQFWGQPKSATQPDPADLFSLLAADIHTTQQSGLQSSLAAFGWIGFNRAFRLQLELKAAVRQSRVIDDLGDGLRRVTVYERTSFEAPLLLKAGWPVIGYRSWLFCPYMQGGPYYGWTLNGRQDIGMEGEAFKEFEWKHLPGHDWGLTGGIGLEWSKQGWGAYYIEVRYTEGQVDLDPASGTERKVRAFEGVLGVGF
jgi:hypothetical protein